MEINRNPDAVRARTHTGAWNLDKLVTSFREINMAVYPIIRTTSSGNVGMATLGSVSVMVLVLASTMAFASGDSTADINARYQAERAACMNGSSNQDRTTCLKEAGAAMAEAKRGNLDTSKAAIREDKTARCDALPGEQKDACLKRMAGQGTVTGSVRDGGVLREITLPEKK
jgi:hypothetical protein